MACRAEVLEPSERRTRVLGRIPVCRSVLTGPLILSLYKFLSRPPSFRGATHPSFPLGKGWPPTSVAGRRGASRSAHLLESGAVVHSTQPLAGAPSKRG